MPRLTLGISPAPASRSNPLSNVDELFGRFEGLPLRIPYAPVYGGFPVDAKALLARLEMPPQPYIRLFPGRPIDQAGYLILVQMTLIL